MRDRLVRWWRGIRSGGAVTPEHVRWAYRLFLDREPENGRVVEELARHIGSTQALRDHFVLSAEYRHRNQHFVYFDSTAIVLVELRHGPRLFVNLADYTIGMQTLLGHYEAAEIALVRRLVQPGDRVVDIGANVGVFTVTLAQAVGPTGRVYAFEPVAGLAGLLRRSLAENRYGWVDLREQAVGDAAGSVELLQVQGGDHFGGSYLWREGGAAPVGHTLTRVPLVRLDDLGLERPIRLIKVDVEGAEPLALRGALGIIKADRPAILAEICAAQLVRLAGCTPNDLIAELAGYGYRCHLIGPDGAVGERIEHYAREAIINVVFLGD